MLDFQKRKKKTFDIALHDGTELKIPTPSLDTYNKLREVTVNQENMGAEDIVNVLRDVLNSNVGGIEVTENQVLEFDLEDVGTLFVGYTNFISEVMSDPNSGSPIAR